jgi:hypothetical protein
MIYLEMADVKITGSSGVFLLKFGMVSPEFR